MRHNKLSRSTPNLEMKTTLLTGGVILDGPAIHLIPTMDIVG
jgi:hypothetical protein